MFIPGNGCAQGLLSGPCLSNTRLPVFQAKQVLLENSLHCESGAWAVGLCGPKRGDASEKVDSPLTLPPQVLQKANLSQSPQSPPWTLPALGTLEVSPPAEETQVTERMWVWVTAPRLKGWADMESDRLSHSSVSRTLWQSSWPPEVW